METYKFTPGPWRRNARSRGKSVSVTACGIPVAQAVSGNADADARLIAAAPEMLYALREAEDLIEMTVDESDPDCPIAATLSVVRAAIRKAVSK